ncbi:FadR family transcriptional regulator [Duganella sp. LX20W]|uniref:FadR family transcriptional regulator n=1 Tax=Rugamonas brunnea TaxID=2758569 RepID=A0A7W2EPN6_9BURK|nr:FadR/GntR family transcriptional regulator [Rugamonas brunnea]MBA5636346.1 FadR family transcriptional regulator [Rugamonas brunnea]
MSHTVPVPLFVPRNKKPRNLAQGVVESVTARIRSGDCKPGDKLPAESDIMEQHGVSRTVVREAISHLQAAGLVQTRHGVGTFVLAPQPARLSVAAGAVHSLPDLLAVLELRMSVETEAAWLAATRRSAQQVAQMEAALRRILSGAALPGVSEEAEQRFHLLIAEATGNRYFIDLMTDLGQAIIPRAHLAPDQLSRLSQGAAGDCLQRIYREHEDIYYAIERQDPEAARAAMRTNLCNCRERLRRAQAIDGAPATV